MFDDLILRLAVCRGKDIPTTTSDALKKMFSEMGQNHAERIVSVIEEFDNIPSNIIGVVKKLWRERKSHIASQTLKNENWSTNSDEYVQPEEWRLFFAIHEEIMVWHRLRYVEYNNDGLRVPCDVLEWKRMGCPKTWSPLLDSFLEGFLRMHSASGKNCENFLRGFLIQLQNLRKEKEKKLSDRSNNQTTVINNSHITGENISQATGN